MRPILLFLFASFLISGCGLKLEAQKVSQGGPEEPRLTGMTPVLTAVHGSSVDAKISVTPSSQIVRGLSIGAKVSVQ